MNNADHKLAHNYIAALSCTKEGRELVEALECVRYYHSEGRVADLGHDGVFVSAVDAYDDGEEMGAVLLPGQKDRLTYQTADFLGSGRLSALSSAATTPLCLWSTLSQFLIASTPCPACTFACQRA